MVSKHFLFILCNRYIQEIQQPKAENEAKDQIKLIKNRSKAKEIVSNYKVA